MMTLQHAMHVDAVSEVVSERSKCSESRVYLDTHKAFGVHPTTFAEFARRNAAAFGGELHLETVS